MVEHARSTGFPQYEGKAVAKGGGTYMKDGGMDRDPKKPSTMKVFKHGAKYTIKKGPERSPAMSNGMHGQTRGNYCGGK